MEATLRQRKESMPERRQPGFLRQSLSRCVYLLEKSLDRYDYFMERGAPDILVDAEKVVIRRQLQLLLNLRAELTK